MVNVCSYLPELELIDKDMKPYETIRLFGQTKNRFASDVLHSLHQMNTFYENDVRLFKRAIQPGCLDTDILYADTPFPEELLLSLEESVSLYSDVMHLGIASIPKQEYDRLPKELQDIVMKSKIYSGYQVFLIDTCSCLPFPEDKTAKDLSENRYLEPQEKKLHHSVQIVYYLAPLLNQEIQFFDRPIIDGCLFDENAFHEAHTEINGSTLLSIEESYHDMLKTVSHHLMILERESAEKKGNLDYLAEVRESLNKAYER